MREFLDEKRSEIGARLEELEPLVDEYARLELAAAALDGVAGVAPSPGRRRAPRHTAATKAPQHPRAAPNGKPRGRPKGTGTRAEQALEIVTANPGIAIPELAMKMGIKQNYLYRVLPGLADDGLVTKDGRGWRPKTAA